MAEKKRKEPVYKKVWKRIPDFDNGYVWVRTWKNIKTGTMWQASDHLGGRGGDAIYITSRGYAKVMKTFSNFRKAIDYVAGKVGCGYPNASRRYP